MIVWCVVLTFVLQLVILVIGIAVWVKLAGSSGAKHPSYWEIRFNRIEGKVEHIDEGCRRIEQNLRTKS